MSILFFACTYIVNSSLRKVTKSRPRASALWTPGERFKALHRRTFYRNCSFPCLKQLSGFEPVRKGGCTANARTRQKLPVASFDVSETAETGEYCERTRTRRPCFKETIAKYPDFDFGRLVLGLAAASTWLKGKLHVIWSAVEMGSWSGLGGKLRANPAVCA